MWQRQLSMPCFIRYNSNNSNNLVIANDLGLRYTRQEGKNNMDLYSIILVDDEEEVRKSIIKKIEWQAAGFRVVGDAEN